MDVPERRVVGALILLLGISFFAVGLYTGQLEGVVEMLKKTFETAV